MTVIPLLPRGRRPYVRRDGGALRSTPIRGTFTSPSGRLGTMSGSHRVERLTETGAGWWARGVFSGELLDADGARVGTGSRRQTVLATASGHDRGSAAVGCVEVDLLGLTVTVSPFALSLQAPLTRTAHASAD